jgi:hypothetical protein
MKITFEPKTFDGYDKWFQQTLSVIFVKTEEDKQKLHKLLCDQDSAWKPLIDVIQILPSGFIKDEAELSKYCKYTYDCEIHKIKALKKQVDFIFYQC